MWTVKDKNKWYEEIYCTTLSYCGNIQIPRMLSHLYKDATVYLEKI